MQPTTLVLLGTLALPLAAGATDQAFAPTKTGQIEVKQLPQSTVLIAADDAGYFDRNGQLFRRLFRFIRDNDVAMTTPVKAEMDPGRMFFYVGDDDLGKQLTGTAGVDVVVEPASTVMAIGVRGSYSQRNFDDARDQLLARLAVTDGWQRSGEPYAVYWNGPFVPGFLKRFEVHVPVTAASDGGGSESG